MASMFEGLEPIAKPDSLSMGPVFKASRADATKTLKKPIPRGNNLGALAVFYCGAQFPFRAGSMS